MALLRTGILLVASAWLGATAMACDGELPVESPLSISVAAVGKWSDTLVVRDTDTLTVRISDLAQRSLEIRGVKWESSDDGIVSVQPLRPATGTSMADSLGASLSAVVTARARGRARITVSAEQEGVGRASPLEFGITVLEQWIAVSAGGAFTCALTVDLDAFCWGAAMNNQWAGLGVGNAASSGSTVPVPVFGGTKFTAISAGDTHACGVSTAGLVYCWGHNGAGALGDGTFANSRIPIVVSAAPRATSISAGKEISCITSNPATATFRQQNTFCWGFGEIRGRNPGSPVPCAVVGRNVSGVCYPRPTDAVQNASIGADPDLSAMPLRDVSAGAVHACGIHESDARIYCWGLNDFGQRGLGQVGSTVPWAMPTLGPQLGSLRAIGVSASSRATCAIGVDSLAYCWGDNSLGQAGIGTAVTPLATVTRVSTDVKFRSISTASGREIDRRIPLASAHTCAVAGTGRIYCWGSNVSGELGRTSGDFRRPDTTVTPAGGTVRFKAVSTGGGTIFVDIAGPHASAHTCALTDRGAIYCWGAQEAGKLGNGTSSVVATQVTPTRISEP